jgi:maltokinase
MNYSQWSADAPSLAAGSGALLLDGARILAVSGDRVASAGDGVAAALAAAVLSGSPGGLRALAGSATVVADARGGAQAAAGVERAIAVDMTNWSVVVDEAWVVKVVSEWNGADRAARLLGALSARGSTVVPRFLGRVDWTLPDRGTSTVALVSEAVAGASDGWTWAVDDLLALIDDGVAPGWPAQLGSLAARLHADLAGAGTTADAAADAATGTALRHRATLALDAALSAVTGAAGIRLANRAPQLRAAITSLPDSPAAPLFEGHGDLHVGQILRAADGGLWVIDFDGDPQLGAEERERPDYAARDLAHLLTSVDLVGSIVRRRRPGSDARVLTWASEARGALLDAYRAGSAHPFDERLLPGFEAEQLVRELLYAHGYLPRWEYAPDAALSARYSPAPDTTEDPWTPPVFSTT